MNKKPTICVSQSCESGCYRNNHQVEEEDSTPPPQSPTFSNSSEGQPLCIKCKTNTPISALANDESKRHCADCFRSNLYGKFRIAVTSLAMISPSDNVLVAFSGGPASRVALQFVYELQCRAQKNFDACKDRSLPVFGVGVAFIDESAASLVPSDQIDEAIQDMTLIVSNLSPPTKKFYVVPIEKIYTSDLSDGKDRLVKLLDAVNDATGKEDLLHHLRMLNLQKVRPTCNPSIAAIELREKETILEVLYVLEVASENGYNRIILGSCTSKIARHVLAATVKGQGYSLSADVQYVDARWEIPVVLPLRDCTAQELNRLCDLDGLKAVQLFNSHPSGINGLVSSFMALLQEENPSRESTVVRTAGKLTPFHFNKITENNNDNVPLATQRRLKRYNLKTKEAISSESFCPVCYSPRKNSNSSSQMSLDGCQTSDFGAACCSSCQFQILPKDSSSMEHFRSLLPHLLVSRAKHDSSSDFSVLREQIEDCLLSDSEDET